MIYYKYIAIIPARKDSKRLKNKNLIKLKNKSLFNYTLEAAINSKKISKILVSTNILSIIKKNSNKIIYINRPRYLCSDHSTTESAIDHSLKFFTKNSKNIIKNVILLQPTSPLRSSNDINNAIKTYEKSNYDSLLSVYKEKLSIWKKRDKKYYSESYNLKKRIRSQFMKETIIENGAIYIFKKKGFDKFKNRLFGKIGVFHMSKKNSTEIDTKSDLELAKNLLASKNTQSML